MRRICAFAAVCGMALGLAATTAEAVGPQVIISTIPGDASSVVPGTTDSFLQTDFGQLIKSPSGNRWMIQSRAALASSGGGSVGGEVIITGAGTSASLLYRSDVEVPWLPGQGFIPVFPSVTDQYGINDSGDAAFGVNEGGRRVVALHNSSGWSVKARETEAIPFDTAGRVWPGSGFDVAGVSDDGTHVSFRAANANTVPATTAVTYLIVNDAPVAATGTTMPTGQLTTPDRAYDAAGASTYFRVASGNTPSAPWVGVMSLAGTSTNDDLFVRSNVVLAQESFPFSTTTVNQRLAGPDISGNGSHWFVRGQDTGGTVNWVARDGTVVATTGAPIAAGQTEVWANQTGFSRTFFEIGGNDAGNYFIIGGTNAAAPGNSVIVYNGQTVLLRNGAPLDVNNNGVYDDNVFVSLADQGGELYTTFLSNDGYLYTTVPIADSVGTDLGEAVIRIATPGVCRADFNQAGGVSVQDIFDFLTAWFAGSPSADFNGVNGVTVQDIFDFLAAWFQGC